MLNRVEVIVANGDIAHYEQFILFPDKFQKFYAAEASESVHIKERDDAIIIYNNSV